MSNASLTVTFKDGTILHGEYQGSSDVAKPKLFDTEEERNAMWREDHRPLIEGLTRPEDAEVVEIFTTYGDGYSWRAVASKSQKRILAYFGEHDELAEDEYGKKSEYRDLLDKE